MTIGSAARKVALPNSFVLPDLSHVHVGVYNLGGALGRDALTALNLQMSKLDEVLMCATRVVLRKQRHGDVIEVLGGRMQSTRCTRAGRWRFTTSRLR